MMRKRTNRFGGPAAPAAARDRSAAASFSGSTHSRSRVVATRGFGEEPRHAVVSRVRDDDRAAGDRDAEPAVPGGNG